MLWDDFPDVISVEGIKEDAARGVVEARELLERLNKLMLARRVLEVPRLLPPQRKEEP